MRELTINGKTLRLDRGDITTSREMPSSMPPTRGCAAGSASDSVAVVLRRPRSECAAVSRVCFVPRSPER